MITLVTSEKWVDPIPEGHTVVKQRMNGGKPINKGGLHALAQTEEETLLMHAVNIDRKAVACRLIYDSEQRVWVEVLVQTKPCMITVRCTPHEYRQIKERADDSPMSMNKWATWMLLYGDH